MTPNPHPVSSECIAEHCMTHHVDEDDAGAYRVCGDCGHAYRTPGELRAAYRHTVLSRPTFGIPRWRLWRRALTVCAVHISFCPYCVHSF